MITRAGRGPDEPSPPPEEEDEDESVVELVESQPKARTATKRDKRADLRSIGEASSITRGGRYLRRVMLQERIAEKLTSALKPVHLDVLNESHQHSVAPGSETHFKVLIVSAAFEGQPLIARHRAVNTVLADELRSGVHALSIRALTPSQWEADGASGFQSPPCLGGSKVAAKG